MASLLPKDQQPLWIEFLKIVHDQIQGHPTICFDEAVSLLLGPTVHAKYVVSGALTLKYNNTVIILFANRAKSNICAFYSRSINRIHLYWPKALANIRYGCILNLLI